MRTGGTTGRTGSPKGSLPTLPTVQRPNVKWSSGVGVNASRVFLRGIRKYGGSAGGLSSSWLRMTHESTQVWEERWHPLREEWVIVAAHRQGRPWVGAT